jgi:hypothetical protein
MVGQRQELAEADGQLQGEHRAQADVHLRELIGGARTYG